MRLERPAARGLGLDPAQKTVAVLPGSRPNEVREILPTLLEAAEDMEYSDESDYEPGETLAEAENELGISDWIDPDTGAPAEEGAPHIEDH